MRKIPYINHVSPIVFPGPYALKDTKFFLFPLKGDQAKIQASVDSFFVDLLEGSGIHYEVISEYMALGASYMNAVSLDPETAKVFGGFLESDYAAWVPLLKWVHGVPVGLFWFMPFVLVDNPLAIDTGREVYGFQKNQGVFSPAAKPTGPVDFKASAWSLQTYSPTSRVQLFELFQLTKTGKPADGFEILRDSLAIAAAVVEETVEALADCANSFGTATAFLKSFGSALFLGNVPMLFLKQFRSATDTKQACYQAVVETAFQITELQAIKPIFDDYKLTFEPNATYNLAEDYGLSSGVTVDVSLEVDMSFDLPAGKIVFPRHL